MRGGRPFSSLACATRPHAGSSCRLQATHGCGDLIFSSHTTFVLTGVLTYTEYGQTLIIKVRRWPGRGGAGGAGHGAAQPEPSA